MDIESDRILRLFHQAVNLSNDDRDRFLRDNCKSDNERAELSKLLHYDAIDGGGLTQDFVGDHPEKAVSNASSRPGRASRIASEPTSPSDYNHGRFLPGTVLSDRYRLIFRFDHTFY